MISGINHLTFAVAELERSFAFYKDVLGPLMRWRSGAYLLAGDQLVNPALLWSVQAISIAGVHFTL